MKLSVKSDAAILEFSIERGQRDHHRDQLRVHSVTNGSISLIPVLLPNICPLLMAVGCGAKMTEMMRSDANPNRFLLFSSVFWMQNPQFLYVFVTCSFIIQEFRNPEATGDGDLSRPGSSAAAAVDLRPHPAASRGRCRATPGSLATGR